MWCCLDVVSCVDCTGNRMERKVPLNSFGFFQRQTMSTGLEKINGWYVCRSEFFPNAILCKSFNVVFLLFRIGWLANLWEVWIEIVHVSWLKARLFYWWHHKGLRVSLVSSAKAKVDYYIVAIQADIGSMPKNIKSVVDAMLFNSSELPYHQWVTNFCTVHVGRSNKTLIFVFNKYMFLGESLHHSHRCLQSKYLYCSFVHT